LDEEFKYLEKVQDTVTIKIPRKDFEVIKLLYHYAPHKSESFSDFVFLAAKKGLHTLLWEAPDFVQARLWLATIDKDPYVPSSLLYGATGLPDTKPPRFPLKAWKSPNIWHINWYTDFYSWWFFTPRWKR
jgi:hypothetical protein